MNQRPIREIIHNLQSIEDALDFFEIGYDLEFISQYRHELVKRFAGYLLLEKPNDWFEARRALKNAYCRVQRSRLDRNHRSACRGCTTCQRR